MISDPSLLVKQAAHISKRFCQQIKVQTCSFHTSILGLPLESERRQYANLLINRIIAVYFLQHQGWLAGDKNYLANQLQTIQHRYGKDHFYARLLLPLFQQLGASRPVAATNTLPGHVPALGMPLFSRSPIEQVIPSITIEDEAFRLLFAFLNTYQWQLTPTAPLIPDTLSPEILACVFEQQVNQKQMGAYYTGSDVTTYIARNTILPYLFEAIQTEFPPFFAENAPLRRLLRSQPERYIYKAMRSETYLPCETEREYHQRRTRYKHLCQLLRANTFSLPDDLVTHNLDQVQLALDIINDSEQPEILLAFFRALEQVTILDPTCGAGAFLLAALHTLEQLYNACLERMRLLDSPSFHAIFRRVERYPNHRCFTVSSILAQNLHGVDIMEEATAICKMNLLLALLAHVPCREALQPLHNLDRTIRTGNAVTGNIHPAHSQGKTEKAPVKHQKVIRAHDYKTFEPKNTDPFHWDVEFPEVMQRGGFAIIIGNPPYVEYSKVRRHYQITGEENCGNLYAAVIERALALSPAAKSYLGLLVPLSLCGSERFTSLRRTILQQTATRWLATFEIFPSRLFEGAFQRLCIFFARRGRPCDGSTFVTRIQRWYTAERPHLLSTMTYTITQGTIKPLTFPKLASPLQEAILHKVCKQAGDNCIATILRPTPSEHFVYYQEATNYWTKAVCHVPFYQKNGVVMPPSHGRFLYFQDESSARVIMALLNSSLFYLWFATFSDGFHLSHALVKEFPVERSLYTSETLSRLAKELEEDIRRHATLSSRNTRIDTSKNQPALQITLEEYHMSSSKPLLDQIDTVLAQHYSFTPEELDFILNYEIKYRLGRQQSSNRYS
jgi:hypothetical protein